MVVLSLHVTHRATPLPVLERLTEDKALVLSAEIRRRFPGVEVVSLRTCNRFELYLEGPAALRGELRAHLASLRLAPGQFLREGPATVQHLFRVASGLDSQLVGEREVLGQVRDAYRAARERGEAGPSIGRLFERAIHVGRTVRKETGLSRTGRSLARLAVEEALRSLPHPKEAVYAVVGAGRMGEKVLTRLEKAGAKHLLLANRPGPRSRALGEAHGVEVLTVEELLARRDELEVLFLAASARRPVVSGRRLARRPQDRPLLVVDLGNPRNLDPRGLPSRVRLIDLPSLKASSHALPPAVRARLPAARRRVTLEARRHLAEDAAQEVSGLAQRLFRLADSLSDREAREALRRLTGPTPAEEVLKDFARALTRGILTPPLRTLRTSPARERTQLLAAAERLFSPPSGRA